VPTVAKKPAAAKKSTAKAAQVAAAEITDLGPRFGTFRGEALTLPRPELPATFAMDLAEMQASRNIGILYTLVVDLAGADGWRRIRAKVAKDGDSLDDFDGTVKDIISAVSDPYEVDEGK
jgi:hypothetical protein